MSSFKLNRPLLNSNLPLMSEARRLLFVLNVRRLPKGRTESEVSKRNPSA